MWDRRPRLSIGRRGIHNGTKSNSYTYAYNAGNELTSMTGPNGTTSYTYDDWGRQTSKSWNSRTASYEYRYGGMLYEVLSDFPGEGDLRIEYRGDRKRHSTAVPGMQGTKFDWDAGWNQVHWRAESDGAVRNTMVADPYSPVNAVAYDKHGGIHFADQIGSTRALMTETGQLARTRDYEPYGGVMADSGGAVDSFFQFGGKAHMARIGLSYFPYRYYSPGQARWMKRDPLGMVDGPNAFAYVGGNPVNRVDPLGLFSWFGAFCACVCGVAAGAVVAVCCPEPVSTVAGGIAGGITGVLCYVLCGAAESIVDDLPDPEPRPIYPPDIQEIIDEHGEPDFPCLFC